jgi:hypothetical protein
VLNFNFWGYNPLLYEYWGTVDGTLNGKPLTSGYAWIEHVPSGGGGCDAADVAQVAEGQGVITSHLCVASRPASFLRPDNKINRVFW